MVTHDVHTMQNIYTPQPVGLSRSEYGIAKEAIGYPSYSASFGTQFRDGKLIKSHLQGSTMATLMLAAIMLEGLGVLKAAALMLVHAASYGGALGQLGTVHAICCTSCLLYMSFAVWEGDV